LDSVHNLGMPQFLRQVFDSPPQLLPDILSQLYGPLVMDLCCSQTLPKV